MNALKRFRRLRAVPDVKHEPSHSAGDERPSLTVVRGVGVVGGKVFHHDLPADALDDAPPVVPVRVSARPGDPTPIFDSVMFDKWWLDTPEPTPDHNGDRAFHALATQFEVAIILDEFTADDRAEIARECVEDVDFGWGPVA